MPGPIKKSQRVQLNPILKRINVDLEHHSENRRNELQAKLARTKKDKERKGPTPIKLEITQRSQRQGAGFGNPLQSPQFILTIPTEA